MKKYIAFLLSIALCICFIPCNAIATAQPIEQSDSDALTYSRTYEFPAIRDNWGVDAANFVLGIISSFIPAVSEIEKEEFDCTIKLALKIYEDTQTCEVAMIAYENSVPSYLYVFEPFNISSEHIASVKYSEQQGALDFVKILQYIKEDNTTNDSNDISSNTDFITLYNTAVAFLVTEKSLTYEEAISNMAAITGQKAITDFANIITEEYGIDNAGTAFIENVLISPFDEYGVVSFLYSLLSSEVKNEVLFIDSREDILENDSIPYWAKSVFELLFYFIDMNNIGMLSICPDNPEYKQSWEEAKELFKEKANDLGGDLYRIVKKNGEVIE